MATQSRAAIHAPKNRLKGVVGCTNLVQVAERSNSTHADIQRRDLTIQYLHALGKSNNEIAAYLKVHRNLVSRVVKHALPPADEMLATLKRLDEKAINEIESALDCGEHKYALPAAEFYLSRRSILGEEAPAGPTININIIEAERAKKLETGLARYGLVRAMAAGDN